MRSRIRAICRAPGVGSHRIGALRTGCAQRVKVHSLERRTEPLVPGGSPAVASAGSARSTRARTGTPTATLDASSRRTTTDQHAPITATTNAQPVKFGVGAAWEQRRKPRLATSRRPLRSTATTRMVLRPERSPATLTQTENRFLVVCLISLPATKTVTLRKRTLLRIRNLARKPRSTQGALRGRPFVRRLAPGTPKIRALGRLLPLPFPCREPCLRSLPLRSALPPPALRPAPAASPPPLTSILGQIVVLRFHRGGKRNRSWRSSSQGIVVVWSARPASMSTGW